jgi:cyanophycinase
MPRMRAALAFLSVLLLAAPAVAAKPVKLPYTYARVGSPADAHPRTTPGTVMMGGSTDVDAAFEWMCSLAGNGDFLVIRATGTDAYNPYVQALCPKANSVATLIVPDTTAAEHPDVAAIMASAEAVFIAGGDQSDYILEWTNTPVQDVLQSRIDAGVPIGGTSAGLNVLTPIVYSAEASQGVTSDKALADPYNRAITLARDFVSVPALAGTLGDPHFMQRDRMGRDLAFFCRVYENGWSSRPRGIEVDEETALLVDDDGSATVVGQGFAYFLRTPGAPEVCAARTPLTYRDVDVYRIDTAGAFDLPAWTGSGGSSYRVSAVAGALTSTQAGGSVY